MLPQRRASVPLVSDAQTRSENQSITSMHNKRLAWLFPVFVVATMAVASWLAPLHI
jgi:hypothetical protein